MGYLPPHPRNPPSKAPVLTLLKQARAVGVGVMLCTQNPVDMDYKAMSNANTWLVGRLATRQDRARVVDGLEDGEALGQLIARLPPRTFLLRDERGVRAPCAAATPCRCCAARSPGGRWAMLGRGARPADVRPAARPCAAPWLDPGRAGGRGAAVRDGVGEVFRALVYGRLGVRGPRGAPGGVGRRARRRSGSWCWRTTGCGSAPEEREVWAGASQPRGRRDRRGAARAVGGGGGAGAPGGGGADV
jgi:hypothetical protein